MSARPRSDIDDDGGVIELSEDETRALFEERARTLLGMSGEEFLERWRAGEFKDEVENDKVWQVVFLLGGDFAPR
jgi:hypothetical protein